MKEVILMVWAVLSLWMGSTVSLPLKTATYSAVWPSLVCITFLLFVHLGLCLILQSFVFPVYVPGFMCLTPFRSPLRYSFVLMLFYLICGYFAFISTQLSLSLPPLPTHTRIYVQRQLFQRFF